MDNAVDQIQKIQDQIKQQQKDIEDQKKAYDEAQKCDWNLNIFDGKNCLNKKVTSFKDGFVSGIMAIPDSIPGILDRLGDIPNHIQGKDTKYTIEDILINGVGGAVAIVATAVALVITAVMVVAAIVSAPFTGGLSLALLGVASTALTIAGVVGGLVLAGNMFLDNSDKPKFINPFESENPVDYLSKIGDNAKTKIGSIACGEGGTITNIDEDQIGDFEITDPEYCAGRITSAVIQAILFGGLKKGIDKKLGLKKPTIIDPDCGFSANPKPNPLLAFVFRVRVEAACGGSLSDKAKGLIKKTYYHTSNVLNLYYKS
ncbi:MAG: hypothetical protein WCK98_01040 [bacterium]